MKPKKITLSIQTFHEGEIKSLVELKKLIAKVEKKHDAIISYKVVD